jgi:hypothetical protein
VSEKAHRRRARRAPPLAEWLAPFWETDRSLSVLALLLGVLAFGAVPLSDLEDSRSLLLDVVFALLLLSGIAAVAHTRAWVRPLGALAVLVFLVRTLAAYFPSTDSLLARDASSLVYCALLGFVVGERVLRAGPVTLHRISGSVAVYLLFGVAWTLAYAVVYRLDPRAFAFAGGAAPFDPGAWLLYFSFATLTTVGYGDVTAVHAVARSLAMLEALIGQLFPAILIARLVGLSLQRRDEPR